MSVMSDAFPRQQDERIRQDVIRQIGWRPEIQSRDISVKVQDAGVALTGFVHTYLEKRAAENAAKSVFGVLSVANDIEVRPATKRTDPEIARDVLDALRIHSAIPHEKVKVLVHDGLVTLEGMVAWDFQRRCATRVAGEVNGVKSVIDSISLTPSASPKDVKEKIEEAWKRTFDLDARRMLVTAEGGAVSLWGTVHSWNEREEAEHAAWQAPGVQRVANHIAVQV